MQSRDLLIARLAAEAMNAVRLRMTCAQTLAALEATLPLAGWSTCNAEDLRRERRLGNEAADVILRARATIQKARTELAQ